MPRRYVNEPYAKRDVSSAHPPLHLRDKCREPMRDQAPIMVARHQRHRSLPSERNVDNYVSRFDDI